MLPKDKGLMTIKNIWKATLAFGAMTVSLAAPAAAAEINWKAAIIGPQRTTTVPIEWFAKEMALKTGGRLKIEFTYSHPASGALEMLRSGAYEATYLCASYDVDKAPLTTVLDLPMLAPENITALGRVELALADHPAIQAELRKLNMKMLIPIPLPQYQLMGTRRIAKADDFQGAKMRIPAEMGKLLEEFGATITLISATDSPNALKTGALDVIALSYPYSFATYKLPDVSKYVTNKISLGAPLCYFAVNQKAWDALSPKMQETALTLRVAAVAQYDGLYSRDLATHEAAFKQKGLEFVPFNATDRARLTAKAIKYWQAWIGEREKQGHKGREVFEFVQAKIREFAHP
jgi:TRAP-type C4-dicarboxylate transport system substrate-binding protein